MASEALQVLGWLLTVAGQLQIARKCRSGFLTWIAANGVLIALSMVTGLWWSVGMYLSNVAVCAWSFKRWERAALTR